MSIVAQLNLTGAHGFRFVFPHAPVIPVTINGSMKMRAWYDITNLSMSRDQDIDGIQRAGEQIQALIQAEQNSGVPLNKIFLAGFSQGGAVALHVGLRYPERLAGIIALSSYLLMGEQLDAERSEANRDIPLFMAHGVQDPVVPYIAGQNGARQLAAMNYPLSWHSYNMQHNVCMEEIQAVSTWIAETIDDA